MAKKSYKLSYYVFYACVALILVVLGLFVGVGYNNPVGEYNEPQFTELLMYLMYFLFGVGVLCALGDLVLQLMSSPKETVKGLAPLFGTIALLIVTYVIGSSDPITLADGSKFTDTTLLKVSDSAIFASYVLLAIATAGVLINLFKGAFKK